MESKPSLQEAVRTLRHSFVDTQEKFARRLGVSVRSVLNYELDKPPRGLRLIQLMQLSEAQNLPQIASVFAEKALESVQLPAHTPQLATLVVAVKKLELEIAQMEAKMGRELFDEAFSGVVAAFETIQQALERLIRSDLQNSSDIHQSVPVKSNSELSAISEFGSNFGKAESEEKYDQMLDKLMGPGKAKTAKGTKK